MFALAFRFPAGRYHATPWGRNVNEADIAWPPEPWRLLRALIAAYWRKGDHERWPPEALGRLIDALAETLPVYRLPCGAIHAHTRHYMPARGSPTLIFDAFARIPEQGSIIAAWPAVTLDADIFSLGADLAEAIGYLGRAESWTDCEALDKWDGEPNCGPVEAGFSGDPVRLLAPLSPAMYTGERDRLIANERERIRTAAKKPPSAGKLETEVTKAFRSKASGLDTVPERLVDALALDTADFQDRRWHRPPAAREFLYARDEQVAPVVTPRTRRRRVGSSTSVSMPTVARYLLAGRPRPRVEDTIKIGELMRLAALSQFGWQIDASSGRRIPKAPWQISGRDSDGRPLRDPAHRHAFWLPEDADSDGLIDHVSVFIPDGIDRDVQAKLDRITRLWVERKQRADDEDVNVAGTEEWRLALEGFATPSHFTDSAPIFGCSTRWRSATPFVAAGHLKADRHAGEFRRLVRRIGMDGTLGFDATKVDVRELTEVDVGGSTRHALHFHRFRSRGREKQHDTAGALLQVTFPVPVNGPLVMGYGSHFGLGLFVAQPRLTNVSRPDQATPR